MSLEEQIELFTQNLVTKNNLPSWFHRTIKDLISKNVTIEEWNTFTQYISNNASDIKSIEEFVLILAEYIEGYCSKDYVDEQDAATLASAKSYADKKFETKDDAFSGNYNDLDNKPTIPTVNNNTITITQGGVTKGTFTLNQNSNSTISLDAGSDSSYTKSEIDSKDTATLESAKNYTDSKIAPATSVYEYELIFTETDHDTTWHFIFNSTNGTLVNTSVPEDYSELCQFVTDYGIPELVPGTGFTSHMRGFTGSYTDPKFAILYMYTSGSTDVIKVSDGDTFTNYTIDASNLDTNSIKLLKRQC